MTPPKISLLLPTRGRPELARRFLQSIVEKTENLPDVEVILYIDEDDLASHGVIDDRFSVTRIISSQVSLGAANTACLRESAGRVVILVNDDVLIRTDSWDRILLDFDRNIRDGLYLAYANDLFKRERLATFPILSRKCCELLVEPFPEHYRGALIDVHLFDIFKRLQRSGYDRIFYLEDIIFEHLHYRTGKAQYDGTYFERSRFGDDATFISLRSFRQASADRLRAAVEGQQLCNLAKPGEPISPPSSLFGALARYADVFLGDGGLPFRHRGFLFTWFVGRYLAERGCLSRFLKDSRHSAAG